MTLLNEGPRIETPPADLTLYFGWKRYLAEQLIEKSKQPRIRDMNAEDADLKFTSVDNVLRWRKRHFSQKNPMIAWLGTAAGELAGMAGMENANHRSRGSVRLFWVRVYDDFDYFSNATELTTAIHERFDSHPYRSQSRFVMRSKDSNAFSVAIDAGYRLSDLARSEGTQIYTREKR